MTCSVLILTRDEEVNIADCIASAGFSDDIVVFDSFSTDATVSIAKKLGARVFQNRFENYSAQREAARVKVDYRYEWVLAVDADERVDEDLAKEVPEVIRNAGTEMAAYRVCTKDYFKGQWLRRASLYPSWHIRLYRHNRVRYTQRAVHELLEVDGSIGALQGHLIHQNFSKGIAQWWQRHIRYAELEAAEMLRQAGSLPSLSRLLSNDPMIRRKALKALSYQLPFRPELRFLYMMFVRGGVLDGPVGWEYCRMIGEYQRITDQIYEEYQREGERKSAAPSPRELRAKSEDDALRS